MIKVNSHELSKNEFQGACYNYMSHTRKHELTDEDKMIVANQLVDSYLLIEEGKQNNYIPEESVVEDSFDKLVSQFPSREQFDKTLKEMGDSIEVVKERLKDDITLKTYIEGEFYSKINVAEDDVKGFYTQNEDRFVAENQVRASHILVKDEEKINSISEQIKSGSSFEEIAKEHSECPSGQNGGDLGFFGKGKMVPEFETTAFGMNVDEVSAPFKTDFGFHIIKLTDKQEGGKQPFEAVSANIKNHLEQLQAQDIISKKIVELREGADINIDLADM